MKVGVIAADELRDRQRFISEPLRHGGHDVYVVKTRPLGKFLCDIAKLIIRTKPDAIVFMGAGAKELLVLGFVKLARIPFAIRLGGDTVRDYESVAGSFWGDGRYFLWGKFKLLNRVARFFLKRAGVAIVVNEVHAARIAKQLKAPAKVFVISQFCAGAAITRNYTVSNPIELLTVTNFRFSEKAKGVIWLIEHLNLFVCKYRIAVHFRVAGAGQHLEDVKRYLWSLVKSELLTVDVAGFVTNLDGYYRRADAVVYRSYHDATPNVILESKRYGLPLLVNECEEFVSIVEHGVSGLLFPDEKEFCALLKKLLAEETLREKLGRGALREHESKYSMEAAQDKIEAALLEIMDTAGR